MERTQIKEVIVNILADIDPMTEITDETNLLEDVLDSMGILFLLSEVYRQLKVEIPMQDVTIERFSTVDNIVNLVENM